jgi:uncharacterized protein YgbK (DUF1537 family)
MDVVALADDTTGALETGARFAAEEVRSLVMIDTAAGLPPLDPGGRARAIVVDTQTRHVSAPAARDRVLQLAGAARRLGVRHLYKKTDSTLRGNIAAEFQALLDACPDSTLVYAPAYPELGRVVRQGTLSVAGKLLADTVFSRDPLNPSRESSIPALLARGCMAPVLLARCGEELAGLLAAGAGGSIIVCDGASEQDLEEAALALACSPRPCIAAGTGGFARPWIRSLGVPRVAREPLPAAARCLVLSGSMHPSSREQVREADRSGVPVIWLGYGSDEAAATALAAGIAARGWAVLATPGTLPEPAPAVAARFGAVAAQLVDRSGADAIVVFGGDTAFAVLNALGSTLVEPRTELLPGIPLSLLRRRGRELVLVSKAGGFGESFVIAAIRRMLEERT